VQVPIVLTDAEGTVLQINPEAGKLFEADWEPRGRPVERLLRSIFPALMADKQWLRKQHGGQRPVTARDGARWIVAVRQVGEQDKPAGYVVTLKTT